MSGSYVQFWVLYYMDLHCLLVAMVVYSSHGSTLYWSASMRRLHWFMSYSIDVLQMPVRWYAPIKLALTLKVITYSIKALTYRIPLASCFGGHSITLKICHHYVIGSLTYTFSLKSQTWRESYSRCWFQHTKLQHHSYPQGDKRYLVQHHPICVRTR